MGWLIAGVCMGLGVYMLWVALSDDHYAARTFWDTPPDWDRNEMEDGFDDDDDFEPPTVHNEVI